MENLENKTVNDLVKAIKSGQMNFTDWDFVEDESAQNLDLSGITFESCFLFLDFKNANLTNSKFINCNMKTADFRGANLKNGLIKNCSVESTMFKGANIEGLTFENNGYFGIRLGQSDLVKLIEDEK